mgnify:CR=1 FL=1
MEVKSRRKSKTMTTTMALQKHLPMPSRRSKNTRNLSGKLHLPLTKRREQAVRRRK